MQYFFYQIYQLMEVHLSTEYRRNVHRHATFLKEVTQMQLGVVTTSTWEMEKADSLYSSIFPGCKTTTYAI